MKSPKPPEAIPVALLDLIGEEAPGAIEPILDGDVIRGGRSGRLQGPKAPTSWW